MKFYQIISSVHDKLCKKQNKVMDVNEHERLSNNTLKHKLR
jgi:hypothetical protein